MPEASAIFTRIRLLAFVAIAIAVCALSAETAQAQIVVMVNGSPITAIDIEQRTKFEQVSTRKTPSRQDVINLLIDDRLKVFIAKRYGLEISDAQVDQAIEGMARRTNATAAQLTNSLAQNGISVNALKAKVRADLAWAQLVRGRFNSSLQIGDAEVNNTLRLRGIDSKETVGYTFKLYPITVVVPRGSSNTTVDGKRRIAESLRNRFQNCSDGLRLARALRDVAVREPITRNSADLTPQLRELLNALEVGRMTAPETAAQGFQMFALCEKKQTTSETAAKREVRDEIFAKRFEERGNKFLDEVRRSAMIEYR